MATRFWRRTALYVGLTFGVLFSPVVNCSSVTQAQTSVSVEFRTALEPHGRWSTHQRWGEVWIPTRSAQDWRPYKLGRWVYSDEWGWYWDSNEEFGLIVYHYGRWVFDRDLGWVWVPGREWGPGWVNWRRGAQHVGWSPLPPDDIVADYWEEPDVWVFVRARDLTAPRIATVVIPVREQTVVFRETIVVNRTVVVRDRGVAVNPGIPPTIIAAAIGRPIRAVEVRPAVLAGTARIPGAVEFRADELRRGRTAQTRVTIRETTTTIRPADRVPPPQPLAKGDEGRLGDNPPRAARAAPGQPTGTPTTTQDQRPQPGAPATTQDQRQDRRERPGAPATTQDQRQDRRERPGAPATTQDQRQRPDRRESTEERQQQTPATTQDQRQQRGRPDTAQERQRTPSGAAEDRRARPDRDAQEERQRPAGAAQEQRQRPEGREKADDQRQQRGRDAARERQQGTTEGRSPPPSQRPDAQPAARPERPEGQRSEQRGEQRGQQRPEAGQRPGRGPQDKGEKKEEKKDER